MTSAASARVGNDFWQFDRTANSGKGQFRYNWTLILPRAAEIVRSYVTTGVTLRQLFYRLVAAEMLPNTQQAYGGLSKCTAAARREGRFPALMDNGRSIERPLTWSSAQEALGWLVSRYREPRARTQEVNLYVGVEKNGLRAQLFQWFAPLGVPIVALGGYASQTLADEVAEDVARDHRPAVLIYAGDFDADGEDILRDFVERVGVFDYVRRVALTPEQVEQYQLPPQPGKWTSARAFGFARKYRDLFTSVYGLDLVQIELDAIPPDELQAIYRAAISELFDMAEYDACMEWERVQRAKLETAARGVTG